MRDIAQLYKTFSDDTRLKMLWLLLNQEELCVCDFMEVLALPQSTASRHLRNLLVAGLVADRRAGLWVYYSLRSDLSEGVKAHVEAVRATLMNCKEVERLDSVLAAWRARKDGGQRCAGSPEVTSLSQKE